MTETRKLFDILWPNRVPDYRPDLNVTTFERGARNARDTAIYHLDRLPLGRRLALAWLVLTWPWRD